MDDIKKNVERILERVQKAAVSSGRKPEEIKVLAATKTVTVERIGEAIQAGITIIGENYVQEAMRKKDALAEAGFSCAWHLIGHLQTNKAKYAVRFFDLVQTVDSVDLARELDRRAKGAGKVVQVLIEVNTGGEATKNGVAPQHLLPLIEEISQLNNISVQGLMTVPPWFDDQEKVRPYFATLRKLKEEVEKRHLPGVVMRELSMGMTDDFEAAIKEGATIVRIGRGIFGERNVR